MRLATALSMLFIFSKDQLSVLLISAIVSCQVMFNFQGSNMFSSFVCCFSRTLCSLSVPGKQERVELHAVLRTEIMGKGTCLDSLQWLPSVTFQDYPFCCNWWNFILFIGWIIILLKIYNHAFLQIKYHYFTRDLGLPCVLLLVDSSPRVPVYEDRDIHSLIQLNYERNEK